MPARRISKPKKASDDDPWDDLLEDQGEPIEEPEEEKPAPRKKKTKKARTSGGSGMGGGLAAGGLGAGGLLIACVLIRIAIKFAPTLSAFAPGTPEWRVWKHPTEAVQVEMPASPKSMFKGGQQIYAAEVRRRYACSVGSAALPPNAIGIATSQMADQLMSHIDQGLQPGSTITSRKRIDVQGHPAVEFEGRIEGSDNVARLIVLPGRLVVLEFAFDKTDYPEDRARFFNSLKLN